MGGFKLRLEVTTHQHTVDVLAVASSHPEEVGVRVWVFHFLSGHVQHLNRVGWQAAGRGWPAE